MRGGSYDIIVRQEYGLVIWFALAVGLALGLLPRARPSREMLLVLGSLLAYAGWTALSLLWTESSENTLAELARVLAYVGLVALLASVLDRDNWRAAAAGLGLGVMSVCLLAVASRLAPSGFIVDPILKLYGGERLSYPFGYWNAVGAWGAMAGTMGLAWSAHEKSIPGRALALALVPVACVATYLTYSRAGAAGSLLGAVIVLGFSRNRLTALVHLIAAGAGTVVAILAIRRAPEIAHATGAKGADSVLGALAIAAAVCVAAAALSRIGSVDSMRMPRRAFRPLAATVVTALLIAAAAAGPGLANQAWHQFRHSAPSAGTNPTARLTNLGGGRYDLWSVALKAFDQRPFGGTGAGTFEFWWNRHQPVPEFVRDAHSLWIQNMAELGLPGLLLIVVFAGTALALGLTTLRRSRRARSAGAATAL
ncbi:MAG: O-antigen ligase family protein, partial [Solirubrobacteraceae bacterium]